MTKWIEVATADELAIGQMKTFDIDDEPLLLINLNGVYHVVQDICTHDGAELAGGEIEGDEIICPRHGAHFCIKTGEATCPPAYEPITTYDVKVEQDKIWVAWED